MKLKFEAEAVGGSRRGGTDVFVTLTAKFEGTAEELRAFLADDERLKAVLVETHDELVPWGECACREDWDGETDDFATGEWLENFVKRQLGEEDVAVVPVKEDDEVTSYLVTGTTDCGEVSVTEVWDECDLSKWLREEDSWQSRLDKPTLWTWRQELYREGNAE